MPFLFRRPLRKEADVFDLQNIGQLREYNLLLARDGIDLRIIDQKEYSAKGAAGFEGSGGEPDTLYMRVTYELLNDRYERKTNRNPRPDDFRRREKPPAPPKKKVPPYKKKAPPPEEMSLVQYDGHGEPFIDVEASTPPPMDTAPPKVVNLDLNQAAAEVAEEKKQKDFEKAFVMANRDLQKQIAEDAKTIAEELTRKGMEVYGTLSTLQRKKIKEEALKRAIYQNLNEEQRAAIADQMIQKATEDAQRRATKRRKKPGAASDGEE